MKRKAAANYDALIKPDRVHSSLYTDPEIFADEIDRLFHHGWVFVGHASEVPKPGDFRLKRIGKQPVIMVRDSAGELHLLLNRCRHRGATVCQESRGNARSFRCAYHGWTYKLDGALAGVPYPEAYDGTGFRRENFGRGRKMLDRWIDQVSEGGELDASVGLHKYDYRGNWKLQLENSVDGYHPPTVHASVMAAAERELAAAGSKLDDLADGTTSDLGGGHVTLTQAVPVSQAGKVILLVFPNLALVGIQMRVIEPVAVDRTEVTIIPTIVTGASEEATRRRLREHEGFFGSAGNGSPDDIEVFERVQMGLTADAEPWILLARGKHRERADPAMGAVGGLRDEVSQRGIWRQWKKAMSAGIGIADVRTESVARVGTGIRSR